MKIDRKKNSMGDFYDYCLMDNNKMLYIFFANNLDLYMLLCTDKLLPPNKNITLDFDITKEDYDIYRIFDRLHSAFVNSKENNADAPFFQKSITTEYGEPYEVAPLVDENLNINWISDNGPAVLEDRLVISKEEDSYKLAFIRNDKPMDFGFKTNSGIGIRFRNSGSRYNPFNCVFMELYDNLQKVNPEYHQISFEELDYQEKVKKLKK